MNMILALTIFQFMLSIFQHFLFDVTEKLDTFAATKLKNRLYGY